ncbi:MAG: hypothetical protein ACI81T_004488, partial [Bacteroidia bacterium]
WVDFRCKEAFNYQAVPKMGDTRLAGLTLRICWRVSRRLISAPQ